MDRWDIYKSVDGKCQRCGQKANSIAFEIDYAGRLVCLHCDATVRYFMCDNFAPVLRDPSKFYARKETQYPVMKVLETKEQHRAVRDFVMAHPEIEHGTKLRKGSKLLKELVGMVA